MKRIISSLLIGVCGVAGMSATSWMGNLSDRLPLRRMSIPGAHNAATKSLSTGKCQSKDISGLWDAGVRAFDIRASYTSNELKIYHGSANTGVTLQDAFSTLKEKVNADSEDFAFILLKHENDSSSEWATKMDEFLQSFDADIVQFSPTMTLGDARGKLIVVTRDALGYSKAGFSGNWNDNQAYKESYMEGNGIRETQWLQDNYQYGSLVDYSTSKKEDAVNAMLDYSTDNHYASTWVINYTSGYTGSVGSNSAIESNAKAVNKSAQNYLSNKASGRTGLMFMDYAGDGINSGYYGQSLIDAIVARNSLVSDNPLSVFQTVNNWSAGPAGSHIATLGRGGVSMTESYRDDKFASGEVMSCICEVENGNYLVTLIAHANWTPGRGSIKTEKTEEGILNYAQATVNNTAIDLPIIHNTGIVEDDIYIVPAVVEDGMMKIAINNIREGANWHSIYVKDIQKLQNNNISYKEDFEHSSIGWNCTTGAQNRQFKDGPSDLSSSRCFENWNGSAFTGKIYSKIYLPNGKYRVSLQVRSNNFNSEDVYFYANEKKDIITSNAITTHTIDIDVTDRVLEFGVQMINDPCVNWIGIDDASVTLMELEDDLDSHDHYGNPLNHFNNPTNWVHGDAFTGGNLGYKNNLYVESWRTSGAKPEGTVIYSSQSGYQPGKYLLGAYFFSCYTGGDAYEEDGTFGLAYVTLNGSRVSVPTHNTGNIPTPHELFYFPVTIDEDGVLDIAIEGNGYPNWFGIDVVTMLPFSNQTPVFIGETKHDIGHDANLFAYNVGKDPYSHKLTTNERWPGEKFYENWDGSKLSGEISAQLYLPEGGYNLSLDCYAQNIGDYLDQYSFFANDKEVNKTQADDFETLSLRLNLINSPAVNPSQTKWKRAESNVTNLIPVTYGLRAKEAQSQWMAVKNPTLELADVTVGVDSIDDETTLICDNTDESVYSITGIKVGEGENAFKALTPGLYIYKGKKYVVR